MIKKTMKILGVVLVLNSMPASAYQVEFLNYETSLINQGVTLTNTFLDTNKFVIKKGEPYNQDNDPVFRKSGPESESPQHGYFAVPLLFIGIAGIVLYFLDRD